MHKPRELTKDEFRACFVPPMTNVTGEAAAVDIWSYVDAIDLNALGLPSLNDVHYVYRDGEGRFDQVLIGTGRFNALLAVIVDRNRCAVHGHCVLDLNAEYGISGGHLKPVD